MLQTEAVAGADTVRQEKGLWSQRLLVCLARTWARFQELKRRVRFPPKAVRSSGSGVGAEGVTDMITPIPTVQKLDRNGIMLLVSGEGEAVVWGTERLH